MVQVSTSTRHSAIKGGGEGSESEQWRCRWADFDQRATLSHWSVCVVLLWRLQTALRLQGFLKWAAVCVWWLLLPIFRIPLDVLPFLIAFQNIFDCLTSHPSTDSRLTWTVIMKSNYGTINKCWLCINSSNNAHTTQTFKCFTKFKYLFGMTYLISVSIYLI